MQFEQTVTNSSTTITFTPSEQHTCPHCRTPLEDKTNTAMLQYLFAQVTKQGLENEQLKKTMKENVRLRLETESNLRATELSLKSSNEKLNFLIAQKAH